MVKAQNPKTDRCLGLMEINTVPLGCATVDALLKQAPVTLLLSRPVTPAKYIALVEGEVEAVNHALAAGRARAGSGLIGELFLPQPHPQLIEGLVAPRKIDQPDAIGVMQTRCVASSLRAADAALKNGDVELMEIRLAMGLGGHGFFTFTGEVSSVEAGLASASGVVGESLMAMEVIPQPDPELMARLLSPESPHSDLYPPR